MSLNPVNSRKLVEPRNPVKPADRLQPVNPVKPLKPVKSLSPVKPLNLVKLCVGCDSVEDLESWIADRLDQRRRNGEPDEHFHTTRMVPARPDELLAGGSLYWVIKGIVRCRQRLTAIRPFTDSEGIGRCHLVLNPELVLTQWQPRRAFQGWRYLTHQDAPADLTGGASGFEAMPPKLRLELAQLGLL